MLRRILTAVTGGLLCVVALGCGQDVDILYVDPQIVDAGEPTELRVYGSGFVWTYDAFSDTASGEFTISVSDRVFDDVTWVDASELRVTLPADLGPGLHSVTVSVDGRSDVLTDGLFVRE